MIGAAGRHGRGNPRRCYAPRVSERILSHRPYPPPRSRWAMAMVWHELLFMHWPVDARLLREFVPPGVEIEEFDGSYRGAGPVFRAAPGMLEHFLIDRECLYSWGRRALRRGEIHHGAATGPGAGRVHQHGGPVSGLGDGLLHYATRPEVVAWIPRRVG